MSTNTSPAAPPPLILHMGRMLRNFDDRDFSEFCRLNEPYRIERTSEGDLVIMAPSGAETGRRNLSLAIQFGSWAEADGTGIGFDSSAGFTLPNGAKRSPDAAWVKRERWERLSAEEREGFPVLCPDFVVELRSPSDSLEMLKAKMEEYIANGAKLGWLIDPFQKIVYVYQANQEVVRLENPATISGEPLMPGFVLNLELIW